eukprot:TRINITY_DN11325_c0_g1_i1.p1 TRINITY_DN11325_c0_g1~~TRINITY_DN11325_c0_g1_i1.p1  ORF type:complete len:328 (-),score=55.66 TRINITY_DN11325_c0_g1_i1:65-1048(-)
MYLSLIDHKSQFSELVSKDGVSKNTHYVVKNSPFEIELGMQNNQEQVLDVDLFKKGKLTATLHYDQPEQKQITLVNTSPISYEIVSTGANFADCTIQVKVGVLSNHYERSEFLVKFELELDGEVYSVFSESIRSVSKQNQIKKKIAAANGEVAPTRRRKRARSDLDDTIDRIQATLGQHTMLLNQINYTTSMNQYNHVQGNMHPTFTPLATVQDPYANFESAFRNLLDAYNDIVSQKEMGQWNNAPLVQERPIKRRKLLENASDLVSHHLIQDLVTEVGNEIGISISGDKQENKDHPGDCNCAKCPYKEELEQINLVYMNCLMDPMI